MKKTIVKVLTAALVITTLVCTAAGCGTKTSSSASQSSTESVVSTVSQTEDKSQIEITDNSVSEDVDVRNVDLDKLTQDMIKTAYTGDDTTGQFSALYLGVDDGKPNGCAVMFVTTKATAEETLGGVMNGTYIPVSEKENEDGTKVTVFTVLEPRGMRDTITLTTAADGKSATMSFTGGPYVLNVKPIDSKEAFEQTKKMLVLLESFTAGQNRSDAQSDAATVDAACKNYYAELVSGTLNAENNTYVKSDKLPSASATVAERKEAAGKCTIKGAMEYMGLINEAGEYTIKLDNLSADGAGTIFAKGDEVYIAAVENITDATTFGEIYKNMFEEN